MRAALGNGLLVGELNYMNDRVVNPECWGGVELLHVNDCSFESPLPLDGPLLVAVLKQTTHTIANCQFGKNDSGIAIYLFADESAAAYARVDFKGNRSRALTLADVPIVRQSEYLLLDGGMTEAERLLAEAANYAALNTAVIRTNSIGFSSDFIGTDGTMP